MVVLPWPNWDLSPNRIGSFRQTAASARRAAGRVKALKSVARDQGKEAAQHLAGAVAWGEPLEMVLFIEPPDNIWRDLDNVLAALKSYLDGVADAIGFNDHHIETIKLVRMEKVDDGRVTVELWRA